MPKYKFMNISSFYVLSIFGLFPFIQPEKSYQNFDVNDCKSIILQDSTFVNATLVPILQIEIKGNELHIKTSEYYTEDELQLILGREALESYPVQIFAKLVTTKKTKNISKNTKNTFCFDIKLIKQLHGKAVLKITGYKEAVRIE